MNILKKLPRPSKKKVFELIAFLSFAISGNLFADSLFHSLTRFSSETTQRNTLGEALSLTQLPFFFLELNPAFELSLTSKDLNALHTAVQTKLPILSFLELDFQLAQEYLFPESVSQSNFLLFGRLRTPRILGNSLFVSAGWYKRYVLLKGITLPIIPLRSSYSEHDFAFELGIQLLEETHYIAILKAATFDSLEVFNLNNPYGEVEVGMKMSDKFSFSLVGRYQLLLGFGRRDRFSLGLHLTIGS